MDFEKYRIYHEQHVSQNNGTSKEECTLILSMVPFNIFISNWVTSSISVNFFPVIEFLIIVLPFILNLTILADFSLIIFLNLIVITFGIIFWKTNLRSLRKVLNFPVEKDRSVITNFRACTYFITAICILAVDFKIFPRRFAKTESLGYGLMDLGVGFFICSHGLVEKSRKHPHYLIKVLKANCVLLVLGFFRLALIKMTGYHEHLAEYGVHWNFFFSLFCCKMIILLTTYFSKNMNSLWLALFTGAIHEFLLNLGLKDWVFSDVPRNSFWSANREGLVSCLGFVCLYFSSIFIGQVITYYSFTYKALIVCLSLMFAAAWIATSVLYEITGISRRVVNLGYILWVLSLSLIVIILLLLGNVITISIKKSNSVSIPFLFQAINANALFFFILSNLLTGLINFVFQTFLLSTLCGIVIILFYMTIVCTITYYLFVGKLFFKFN